MTRNSLRSSLPFFSLIPVLLFGCTTAHPVEQSSRYVGYQEVITQNGKRIFSGAKMEDMNRVRGRAAVEATRNGKEVETSVAVLATGGRAIVKRSFGTHGFDWNFGRLAEVSFSIEPCTNISVIDHKTSCTDSPGHTPTVVTKTVRMDGGGVVVAAFPDGLEWTYRILDQPQLEIVE